MKNNRKYTKKELESMSVEELRKLENKLTPLKRKITPITPEKLASIKKEALKLEDSNELIGKTEQTMSIPTSQLRTQCGEGEVRLYFPRSFETDGEMPDIEFNCNINSLFPSDLVSEMSDGCNPNTGCYSIQNTTYIKLNWQPNLTFHNFPWQNMDQLVNLKILEGSFNQLRPRWLNEEDGYGNWYANEEGLSSLIGNVTSLEEVRFTYSQFQGEIPPEIGNLTNLTTLYLYNNDITGEIPSEIGTLTNLTHLLLRNNELTGEIPSEIGNLGSTSETGLTYMWLQYNNLTGEIPSSMGNLTNLGLGGYEHFQLRGNQLTGQIPPEICNLENYLYEGIINEYPFKDNQLCPPYPECFSNSNSISDQDTSECEEYVTGCTDGTACNYNLFATNDDGTCWYNILPCTCNDPPGSQDLNGNGICDQQDITGCMDENACNYNSEATVDDIYCWYNILPCLCEHGFGAVDADEDGICDVVDNCVGEFDDFNICCPTHLGDTIDDCGVCNGDNSSCQGCTNSAANNYDETATIDDGSCDLTPDYDFGEVCNPRNHQWTKCDTECRAIGWQKGDLNNSGWLDTANPVNIFDAVYSVDFLLGSLEISQLEPCFFWAADLNNDYIINVIDIVAMVNLIFTQGTMLGCTDFEACNYDSNAYEDDGTCYYPTEFCDCDGNTLEDYCNCDGLQPETHTCYRDDDILYDGWNIMAPAGADWGWEDEDTDNQSFIWKSDIEQPVETELGCYSSPTTQRLLTCEEVSNNLFTEYTASWKNKGCHTEGACNRDLNKLHHDESMCIYPLDIDGGENCCYLCKYPDYWENIDYPGLDGNGWVGLAWSGPVGIQLPEGISSHIVSDINIDINSDGDIDLNVPGRNEAHKCHYPAGTGNVVGVGDISYPAFDYWIPCPSTVYYLGPSGDCSQYVDDNGTIQQNNDYYNVSAMTGVGTRICNYNKSMCGTTEYNQCATIELQDNGVTYECRPGYVDINCNYGNGFTQDDIDALMDRSCDASPQACGKYNPAVIYYLKQRGLAESDENGSGYNNCHIQWSSHTSVDGFDDLNYDEQTIIRTGRYDTGYYYYFDEDFTAGGNVYNSCGITGCMNPDAGNCTSYACCTSPDAAIHYKECSDDLSEWAVNSDENSCVTDCPKNMVMNHGSYNCYELASAEFRREELRQDSFKGCFLLDYLENKGYDCGGCEERYGLRETWNEYVGSGPTCCDNAPCGYDTDKTPCVPGDRWDGSNGTAFAPTNQAYFDFEMNTQTPTYGYSHRALEEFEYPFDPPLEQHPAGYYRCNLCGGDYGHITCKTHTSGDPYWGSGWHDVKDNWVNFSTKQACEESVCYVPNLLEPETIVMAGAFPGDDPSDPGWVEGESIPGWTDVGSMFFQEKWYYFCSDENGEYECNESEVCLFGKCTSRKKVSEASAKYLLPDGNPCEFREYTCGRDNYCKSTCITTPNGDCLYEVGECTPGCNILHGENKGQPGCCKHSDCGNPINSSLHPVGSQGAEWNQVWEDWNDWYSQNDGPAGYGGSQSSAVCGAERRVGYYCDQDGNGKTDQWANTDMMDDGDGYVVDSYCECTCNDGYAPFHWDELECGFGSGLSLTIPNTDINWQDKPGWFHNLACGNYAGHWLTGWFDGEVEGFLGDFGEWVLEILLNPGNAACEALCKKACKKEQEDYNEKNPVNKDAWGGFDDLGNPMYCDKNNECISAEEGQIAIFNLDCDGRSQDVSGIGDIGIELSETTDCLNSGCDTRDCGAPSTLKCSNAAFYHWECGECNICEPCTTNMSCSDWPDSACMGGINPGLPVNAVIEDRYCNKI